jgi:hypothetical protein
MLAPLSEEIRPFDLQNRISAGVDALLREACGARVTPANGAATEPDLETSFARLLLRLLAGTGLVIVSP